MGESLSVDGLCLTVENLTEDGFTCMASEETLTRGMIGSKRIGNRVHLERALRLSDRLGGHLVQGHVDGVGLVRQVIDRGTGAELVVEIPANLRRYVVAKGSIAVQGVSLTVAHFESGLATIAVIPETLKRTYLGDLRPGERVNLETDVLAKYVESLLHRNGSLDEQKLRDWGFE